MRISAVELLAIFNLHREGNAAQFEKRVQRFPTKPVSLAGKQIQEMGVSKEERIGKVAQSREKG